MVVLKRGPLLTLHPGTVLFNSVIPFLSGLSHNNPDQAPGNMIFEFNHYAANIAINHFESKARNQ